MYKKSVKKVEKIDGLSGEDIRKLRIAIRQVWSWSYPRKLCVKRCTGPDGFFVCELCKSRSPKIQIDHVVKVGDVDEGFIARLFCPSSGLRGLCLECHRKRTNDERWSAKEFF